ncbi:MAG TPA: acetamidase/formamidase family protein [Phenylobacterium sp.]|jgi:acetamidase/formamidase|uniref:acetamidase/formamidase family protein n=1 Tax=Phenylobacterium sp. TaxID=1871053 RepID=UPI002D6055DA|nr:acetamidase/formamidase family protein [Phenylobacterium sp.]HZZ67985.1 acetamidase/formamidase family protein [Phenylobacterium sp.]
MTIRLTAAALASTLAALSAAAAHAQSQTYTLKVTPATVAWGNYDAAAKPVLTIKSGDTVTVDTVLTNSPTGLKANGVPDDQIQASLKDVFANVPASARGPGGHILTGPIAIEGAEPGDTLEIRILKIDLAIPYAYNGFGPAAGILRDDFPYRRTKIIPLDRTRMVANFGPGITLPLRPFFGSMGVAPPPAMGKWDSSPPTIIGGNMDNKELVAGSTLFLPVFAKGALFEVGDGHAGQGNGESDVTALETSLTGAFQFILHKGDKSPYPRAETPTHYIAMGFDDDLAVATVKAVRNMVDFLVTHKGMTKDDAYMLVSVAGDVDITELVDRNKGVHVMMPKAIFAK